MFQEKLCPPKTLPVFRSTNSPTPTESIYLCAASYTHHTHLKQNCLVNYNPTGQHVCAVWNHKNALKILHLVIFVYTIHRGEKKSAASASTPHNLQHPHAIKKIRTKCAFYLFGVEPFMKRARLLFSLPNKNVRENKPATTTTMACNIRFVN